MNLKNKIAHIVEINGFKSAKELSERIEFSYQIFNRNINKGNLTGEMLRAFILHPEVNADLRWLGNDDQIKEYEMEVNEPTENLEKSTLNKLNHALKLLEEVRREIAK